MGQVVVENNRIFLNARSITGDFSQMAINYVTGATQGVDDFDAKYFNEATLALNSVLDNIDYVIQGRALPFDVTDVVPLSFYTATDGNYSISIDHVDGLFSGNQDIILKDNITGIETDLKAGNYTFAAPSGRTTTRFVLKYQKITTTWNGVTWSNGSPTASIEAIIEGDYSTNTNGAISAQKLTINSGVLTVNSGGNLTVVNELINNAGANAVVIENNANLIQGAATTVNTNIGAITIIRNSSLLKRLDYTIWSSPTTNPNQFLKTFSPLTLDERFYNYNETTNLYNAVTTPNLPSATEFEKGTGYLIRMPNTADSVMLSAYPGIFTGVPNNGTISKAITYLNAAHGYNMIGNPYPSTINADAFISANTANIESSLYFWRKINNPLDLSTAYAVYNSLGSTATASSDIPNGTIQVGQGFFVKAKRTANIIFTNAMRLGNATAPFFKTKQVAENNRIWLNLTNTTGFFSQILIGYTSDATLGIDKFDAKYINDSPIALTSSINNEEFSIQGRPAFDVADVVSLNFKTDKMGDYTISLDHFDGVFASGQEVYLVDSKTGTETDLKAGAYNFTATAGVDNLRFSLKFQKTLKIDAPAFNENSVRVYKNNETLYVNSANVAIINIKVFDIQGRLIAEKKNLKTTKATIKDFKVAHQVLIVKILGEDNNLVSKKVVN